MPHTYVGRTAELTITVQRIRQLRFRLHDPHSPRSLKESNSSSRNC